MDLNQIDPSRFPMWNPLKEKELSGSIYTKEMIAARMGATIMKAADSFAAGPLIRQDLEPQIYKVFVQKFPFYEMVRREEANGLVHAYNLENAYSNYNANQPLSLQESASVTDDTNQYQRVTTNIAIFGARRGATLKSMFAVNAGGGPYGDVSQRELDGGITKIAHDVQAELFRFNVTTSTSLATDPNGLYDPNGLNGLRWTLNNLSPAANTVSVNVTSAWTDNRVIKGVRQAANAIIDAGGSPDMVIGTVTGVEQLISDQLAQVRFNPQQSGVEIIPGLFVPKVAAGEAELPVLKVPGDSVGTISTGGHTYTDLYVIDSSTVSMPWLGSARPTVLEIPIGTDGTLRKLYIPFLMAGLALHVPAFLARVQLQLT